MSLWATDSLENVCREITDGSHFSPKTTVDGFPYVTVRDIVNDQIDFNGCKHVSAADFSQLLKNGCKPHKGDVLFSKDGTVGKVALIDYERAFVVLSSLAIVRPDPRRIDSAFLKYVMQSPKFLEDAVGKKTGVAIRRIILRNLKSISVPVPPLPVQQRIVRILDEAFDGIATAKANAERNLANARALFESHLDSIFTHCGNGWVQKTVGELVAEGAIFKPFDGNHGEIHPRKADFAETGVPFIMASDLKNGSVDLENCNFIPRKLADSLRVGFAEDGDVLISHKGTIGRSAIVATKDDYIMLTPQVTSYRVRDRSKLFNRFIRYYFMSPVFQRDIIAGAQDGSTRAYIGITKQLTLRFRFPSLKGQKRIAATLDELEPQTQSLESIYQQKVASLEGLKKSLLHQAFSGAL